MTYSEQLTSPKWQRKRLEILQRDDFTCQFCGDKDKTLHVHHKYYIKNRMPWDYPEDILLTLCEECHENEQSFKDSMEDEIKILLGYGLPYFRIWQILTLERYKIEHPDADKTLPF